MNDVIKIHPEVEFSGQCPVDQAPLRVIEVVIPGMRSMVDVFCSKCGARYFVDLPVSHALWNAVSLNQETLKQYSTRNTNWFSEHLLTSFQNQGDSELTPIVHKFFDAERIIVVNCLDYLYGHSLLKLLNVQRHLDRQEELACCVLVPTQLVHLVPERVAEIWELPLPLKASWIWYPSLQRWIVNTIKQRKEVYLSRAYSHPSNNIFDLNRFVRNLPDVSELLGDHRPVVLFSYRKDRLWGSSLLEQERNLAELSAQLSQAFPSMAFVVVGFGRQNQIQTPNTKLIDLRVDEFSLETDRLWLAMMKETDCCVGVLGSNMLLPSGLAKATIDLVPRHRSYNLFQDILFTSTVADVRDSFLRYRFLYGNETLSDLRVADVVDTATSILAHNERSSYWFRVGESEDSTFPPTQNLVAEAALQYRRAAKVAASEKAESPREAKLCTRNQ